jgi:hypothetical protein
MSIRGDMAFPIIIPSTPSKIEEEWLRGWDLSYAQEINELGDVVPM